jgi:hypothetical protein
VADDRSDNPDCHIKDDFSVICYGFNFKQMQTIGRLLADGGSKSECLGGAGRQEVTLKRDFEIKDQADQPRLGVFRYNLWLPLG